MLEVRIVHFYSFLVQTYEYLRNPKYILILFRKCDIIKLVEKKRSASPFHCHSVVRVETAAFISVKDIINHTEKKVKRR